MKLYHVTGRENLPAILRGGLTARESKPTWSEDFPSNPRMVYLTADPQAILDAWYTGEDVAVLEVEVSEANLYPDEDFLGSLTARRLLSSDERELVGLCKEGWSGPEDNWKFEELWELAEQKKDLWKQSLRGWREWGRSPMQKTCAHLGTIPPERIAVVPDTRIGFLKCADLSYDKDLRKKYMAGGCALFALALQKRLPGSSLVGVAYPIQIGDRKPTYELNHIGVELDGYYYDVRGKLTAKEFMRDGRERFGDEIIPLSKESVLKAARRARGGFSRMDPAKLREVGFDVEEYAKRVVGSSALETLFYHGTSLAHGVVPVGGTLDPSKSTYEHNPWIYATPYLPLAKTYAIEKADEEHSTPMILVVNLNPDARILSLPTADSDDVLRRAKREHWDAVYIENSYSDLGSRPELVVLRKGATKVVSVFEVK